MLAIRLDVDGLFGTITGLPVRGFRTVEPSGARRANFARPAAVKL